jgi:hypothetical protein
MLEVAVRPLVPPVSRECVMGDLSERYNNAHHYLSYHRPPVAAGEA